MAVATVVSFGKNVNGFVSSTTITGQDVGTGSNRAAYVMIGATNTTDLPSSVTIGSDSLTAQGGGNFTDADGFRWRLYAGALTVTGSQTVTATWTDSFNSKIIMGAVFSGVNTTTLIQNLTTGNAATGTSHPTWTIASATDDMVVALMNLSLNNTNTPAAPATAMTGTGLGAGVTTHGMTEAGAASVVIDSTVTTTPDVWVGYGFNVPASGGGSSPSRSRLTALGVG